MTAYELWYHLHLGTFWVRIQAGHVTGVAGPLAIHVAVARAPEVLRYDEGERALSRFVSHPAQFYLLDPQRQGRYLRPRFSPRRC